MRKKIKIVICCFISTLLLNAQSPTFQWAKSMSGYSVGVGTSVKLDALNNVYTVGRFNGTVDFDPGAGIFNLTSFGNYDVFISKLDASGNFLWAKQVGGAANDTGYGLAIDATGNICVVGYFTSSADFDPGAGVFNLSSFGSDDIFILKLNVSGNFLWAKQMGGTNSEEGMSIALDGFGNIYASGHFQGTVDFDPGATTYNLSSSGSGDIFVLKLDAGGNFAWAKNMGGGALSIFANSIAVDAAGNVYTSGAFTGAADFDPGVGIFTLVSTPPFSDIFISKLDALGNFATAIKIGSAPDDAGNSILTDAMSNVYLSGNFGGTADFDPGAGTFNLVTAGSDDVFVLKLDAACNFLWAKSFGGTLPDIGYSIAVDASNNIYTCGYFNSTADFDPGVGIYNLTSAGAEDIFITKLDGAGNFLWAESLGGPSSDFGYAVDLDASDNVYTTGYFRDTVDFDPGMTTFTLTTVGWPNIFVHKMNQLPLAIQENVNENNLTVYPNPSQGLFNIELKKDSRVIVTNVLGKQIFNEITSLGKQTIDIQNQANGIYFVTINNFTQKIIKE